MSSPERKQTIDLHVFPDNNGLLYREKKAMTSTIDCQHTLQLVSRKATNSEYGQCQTTLRSFTSTAVLCEQKLLRVNCPRLCSSNILCHNKLSLHEPLNLDAEIANPALMQSHAHRTAALLPQAPPIMKVLPRSTLSHGDGPSFSC